MITLKINMVTTQDYYPNTDSWIHEIKTDVVYKDFSNDKEMFDLIQNIMMVY